MDVQQINTFILAKGKYFPEDEMPLLREQLQNTDDGQFPTIVSLQYKSPTVSLILSLFLGVYGIDRFYIGDIGLGLGKLLTCGGLGIWTIVDWFLIMKSTRSRNYDKLSQYI